MTTITSEQQKQILIDTANHVISRDNTSPYSENLRELARIALSALKNAPLALSDNQGRPRALVVPPAIEPDYKVIKGILPTANPDEYACCIAADMWNACRADMLQGAEPVSQTYTLPELIEGMEVSIDVSTCGADAGNRYFGTVTEVSELYTAKNGYILLVQDAEPNFDVNGNSPAIPGGWISCSERMPEDEQEVIVHNKLGYRYVSYFDEHSGLFFDMRGGNQMNCIEHILVTHWMPLPAAPEPDQS
ncbi:Eaa protein [Salmonella enterica subsp. enterica serovar Typhi]|nr:DUF551 domain-containing protein [Salmonella enterica]CEB69389.1 Eaa protein [Salmonella enterica subsp. enterica serovar Paratyphi A]AYS39498.1 Eaa protein [Salmonella enterica subsp. enterica serovar Typhi]AYS76992.1 Eaa protein [Salmonella enterica subsp. enterica serovar Typhi]AYT59425.1 Eaa protein [Salmonella enterica subsp. enterica serovar Typhi]AYT60989.1 Eaa protein [Salmonella enterica subsp. enterica serovar Typhi]